MEDIIGKIILYSFEAVGIALPLFVLVQSIWNLVRAVDGRGTIILKALVVLAVWAFVSFTFVMIIIMYVFEVDGMADKAAASRRTTILASALTLVYIALGFAMAYWVRLQPGWKTLRKLRAEP